MRSLLCIVIGLVGCSGGSGGADSGARRLADLSAGEVTALCTMRSFPNSGGCSAGSSVCVYLATTAPCIDLIQSLPDSCGATIADFDECTLVSCQDYMQRCAAFSNCGVTVWTRRTGCP